MEYHDNETYHVHTKFWRLRYYHGGVDRFSKYATFVLASPIYTTKEAAKLFFKNMVKDWSLSRHIFSDQYPHFNEKF